MGIGGERLHSVAAPNSSSSKFRREEHRRTKHDSSFTKWKILIGPTDWENHSLGKEGSERYRIHNLPTSSSPGVYEIGVAVWVHGSGREVSKLDPGRIVVAYLGQAESVRVRLQKYGRGGSHLEKIEKKKKKNHYTYDNVVYDYSDSSFERDIYGGSSRGLFAEIFARGYPIVYRWAPLNSKKDAEKVESKLLAVFDYPWNKVGNGSRRPNDVLIKIDQISSKPMAFPVSNLKFFKLLKALTRKQAVGIPIKSMQKTQPTNKLNGDEKHDDDTYEKNRNLYGRVLKFGRSNPRIVSIPSSSPSSDGKTNPNNCVCGVRLDDDGSVCMNQPVKGRKRCLEHKGKKKYLGNFRSDSAAAREDSVYMPPEPPERSVASVLPVEVSGAEYYSSITTLEAAGLEKKADLCTLNEPISSIVDLEGYRYCEEEEKTSALEKGASMGNGCFIIGGEDKFSPICGVILYDGSPCTLDPVLGRKRCEKHKGRRIQQKSTMLACKIELK